MKLIRFEVRDVYGNDITYHHVGIIGGIDACKRIQDDTVDYEELMNLIFRLGDEEDECSIPIPKILSIASDQDLVKRYLCFFTEAGIERTAPIIKGISDILKSYKYSIIRIEIESDEYKTVYKDKYQYIIDIGKRDYGFTSKVPISCWNEDITIIRRNPSENVFLGEILLPIIYSLYYRRSEIRGSIRWSTFSGKNRSTRILTVYSMHSDWFSSLTDRNKRRCINQNTIAIIKKMSLKGIFGVTIVQYGERKTDISVDLCSRDKLYNQYLCEDYNTTADFIESYIKLRKEVL